MFKLDLRTDCACRALGFRPSKRRGAQGTANVAFTSDLTLLARLSFRLALTQDTSLPTSTLMAFVPLYSLEEASDLALTLDKLKDGSTPSARETEFLISIVSRLKFGEPDDLRDDEALEASSPPEFVGHGVGVLRSVSGKAHGEQAS